MQEEGNYPRRTRKKTSWIYCGQRERGPRRARTKWSNGHHRFDGVQTVQVPAQYVAPAEPEVPEVQGSATEPEPTPSDEDMEAEVPGCLRDLAFLDVVLLELLMFLFANPTSIPIHGAAAKQQQPQPRLGQGLGSNVCKVEHRAGLLCHLPFCLGTKATCH